MPKKRNGPFKFWKDAAFVDQIGKVEAWLQNEMGSGSILKAKRAMFAYYRHLNHFDENELENERRILPLEQIAMFQIQLFIVCLPH